MRAECACGTMLEAQPGPCYGVKGGRVQRALHGGLNPHTCQDAGGPSRPALPAAQVAGRREAGGADPRRARARLRGPVRALPLAPARLLPPHAALPGGRRGRPPGGVREGARGDARRFAPDQRAAVALPDLPQPLPQPPSPPGSRGPGLDGRDGRRGRRDDRRPGPEARGLPRPGRRRRRPSRDSAHRPAAARDGRPLIRGHRDDDGHDGAGGQVAARPRPDVARRGDPLAPADLRRGPARARRGRRGAAQGVGPGPPPRQALRDVRRTSAASCARTPRRSPRWRRSVRSRSG